jgi:hypothetical protein
MQNINFSKSIRLGLLIGFFLSLSVLFFACNSEFHVDKETDADKYFTDLWQLNGYTVIEKYIESHNYYYRLEIISNDDYYLMQSTGKGLGALGLKSKIIKVDEKLFCSVSKGESIPFSSGKEDPNEEYYNGSDSGAVSNKNK